MKYILSVEAIIKTDEKGYDQKQTIYEQTLYDLDIAKLAIFVNKDIANNPEGNLKV